jgi:hypothetical protein
MSDRIITITKGDPATGILTLTDQGTTNVDPSDQVTWVIGAGSGVASITGIVEKPMSFDVFNPDPKQLANSTSWQGTVNPHIAKGTEETYSINWTTAGTGWLGKDGAGQPKSYDPKIKVNP